MKIIDEKFEKVKQIAKLDYNKIKKVKCPFLQDYVYFNKDGFDHLLFKTWNRSRSQLEQYSRLRLLSLVPEIIAKSHTLQEYDERKIFVRQKINSRWEQRMKMVRYYVFVAVVKTVRLKIIVKEIEGGEKFFYSLYPSWKKDKKDPKKKIFYSGNLEED
ncbi:MAG: hypothetical protein Q8O39_02355 [bacterium]|nr:hypothetical protein [bacterium]